jgi:hypothetical protein
MNKLYIVFILFGFSFLSMGCTKHVNTVEDEFKPYVDRFSIEAKNNHYEVDVGRVDIVFTDIPKRDGHVVLGECLYNDQIILVNYMPWTRLTAIRKEVTVFHELGHCVLDRVHIQDTVKQKSIMMPIGLPSDKDYTTNRSKYMHELFHPGNWSS